MHEPVRRHRDNTRARLIVAGRAIFFNNDYARISIDMIAREAGFTRATFYLHFSGKDDLVAAVMLAESHKSDVLFRWFERAAPDAAGVEGFIHAVLAMSRASRAVRLFHLAALQSATAEAAFLENRRRLMSVLSIGLPAFAPTSPDGEPCAEAILALVALEQLALREHQAADADAAAQMVAAVRDQWLRLHARHPSPATPTAAGRRADQR